nr:hypothetical protein DM860_006041 [Ipomoea trifida]
MQFQECSDEVLKMVDEETDFAKTQGVSKGCFGRDQLKYLVMEAIRGGCQGHRAELYAACVAKCLASLEGRDKANVDDLKKAVSCVRYFLSYSCLNCCNMS